MLCYKQYGISTFKESGILVELPFCVVSQAEASCAGRQDSRTSKADIQ